MTNCGWGPSEAPFLAVGVDGGSWTFLVMVKDLPNGQEVPGNGCQGDCERFYGGFKTQNSGSGSTGPKMGQKPQKRLTLTPGGTGPGGTGHCTNHLGMLEITGIGQAKLQKYGQKILDVLQKY